MQPDHRTIGGWKAGIEIAAQVGAIATLRTEEDVGSTGPLHHTHTIVGGAVSWGIATYYECVAVGTAAATTRENDFLHDVYILDVEAGQIGPFQATCAHLYTSYPR
jgi:hypothetical protein